MMRHRRRQMMPGGGAVRLGLGLLTASFALTHAATVPHLRWAQAWDSQKGTAAATVVSVQPAGQGHVLVLAESERPEWAGVRAAKLSTVDGSVAWTSDGASLLPGRTRILASRVDEKGDVWVAGAWSDSRQVAPPQTPHWLHVSGTDGRLLGIPPSTRVAWDATRILSAVFLPDGDLVFAGHGSGLGVTDTSALEVARLDPRTGTLQWRTQGLPAAWTTHSVAGWAGFQMGIETTSGDVMLGGQPTEALRTARPLEFLARLDAGTGRTVWERAVRRSDLEAQSFGGLISERGALHRVGESQRPGETERRLDVVELDPGTGVERWHVRRAGLGDVWSVAQAMARFADGLLWVAATGLRWDPDAGLEVRDLVTLGMSAADGREEWILRLPIEDPRSFPAAVNLWPLTQGAGLVTWTESGPTGNIPRIARVDSVSGALRWHLSLPASAQGTVAVGLVRDADAAAATGVLARSDPRPSGGWTASGLDLDRGAVAWTRTAATPGSGYDQPAFLIADHAGDLVTVGRATAVVNSGQAFGASSGFLVKHRATDGAMIWQHEFSPQGTSLGLVHASTDTAGHVLVVTEEYGVGAVVRQWNGADGAPTWTSLVEMPDAPQGLRVSACVADAQSLVIGVSGWRNQEVSDRLVKIDRMNGREAWSISTTPVSPSRIMPDQAGGIVLLTESPPALERRRAADGARLWQHRPVILAAPHGRVVTLRDLAVGPEGDIHVLGVAETPSGGRDSVVARIARDDGACLWSRDATEGGGGPGLSEEGVLCVSDGRVIVARARFLPNAVEVVLQARATSEGTLLWSRTWPGASALPILAVDSEGRLLVLDETGNFPAGAAEPRVRFAALDPRTGRSVWEQQWRGIQRGQVQPSALAQTPWGMAVACVNGPERSDFGWISDLAVFGLDLRELPELRMDHGAAQGRLRVRALGVRAQVERTVDSRAWHSVGTLPPSPGSEATFQDPAPPAKAAAYRLRIDP